MGENTSEKSYVWHSGQNADGESKVSLLAIVETLGSVALFWALTSSFDIYWLLLSSVLIAFLMLLRSPGSIAMGRDLFISYLDNEKKPSKTKTILIWLASATASGGAVWLLAPYWLARYEGVELFWRSSVLGYLGITIGLAAAVAAAVAATVEAVVAAAAAAAAAGARARAGAVAAAVLLPGFSLGLLCRALAVRFWATFRHLPSGLPLFPDNWLNLTLKTDMWTLPELVPDLPMDHDLHFSSVTKRFYSKDTNEKIFSVIVTPVLFAPAILYRFYLKSTAWLYFPLYMLARVPQVFRDGNNRLQWDSAHGRSLQSKLGFVVSCLVLAYVIFNSLDIGKVLASAIQLNNLELPVTPMIMIVGLNFSGFNQWNWIPALSSAFAVIIFVWSNSLNTRIDYRNNYLPSQIELRFFLVLNGAKTGLITIWISLGVFTLFYYLYLQYQECLLLETMPVWLEWL